MNYTIKILPENEQYIGYALQNDEVKFVTNPCKDAISASREITRLIAENTNRPEIRTLPRTNPLPLKKTVVNTFSTTSTGSRRCCGRG